MFKGYLPSSGKKPTEKYRDRTEFYSYEQVQALNSYCGILGNEFIQIDVDDEKQSNLLFNIVNELNLQCNVIKTTRGKHFYFKNIGINSRKQGHMTPIGVKIDVGLGAQNAPIPLKIDNVEREWLKKVHDVQELPKWLLPIGRNRTIKFDEMGEGDGRNSVLFGYILKLQSIGMSKSEIKETIRIINQFVLSEPLSQNEIDTVLRDESFTKETFYIKGKLQYEPLAKYLRDNEHIILINGILHIYEDGCYSANEKLIEKRMLKYLNNSSSTTRKEVMKYLELICKEQVPASEKYICLKNGILDLETGSMVDFSPNIIIRNKVNWEYDVDAESEIVDKTFNKICCNDNQLRLLIEEMIGYTLLRRNEIGKSFILTGGGSNGKSTLLECINWLLGEDNISNVSLNELQSRFKTFQLDGKLANIGDDISNQYIQDNSTFKNLVTGNKVNVERKGKDAYDMRSYAKLIFSANELPRINDLSEGLKRRIIFVPFNAHFSKNDSDYDPFILDKLRSEKCMMYILKLAIQGLQRLVFNNKFTDCTDCENVWNEYEEINNPVISFIHENDIDNEIVADVYLKYTVFCAESGLKAVSKPVFSKEVKKQGYSTDKTIRVRGKQKRIYTKL